jgi:light-regulated signal transduction histidine kinase (bacteriophytochrome)
VDSDRRLAELKAELDATNDELAGLSYAIGHDFRAPVRAIQGFSEAVLEDYAGDLNPKGQDYLRRVSAAASRLSTLIDDLLRLSQITRDEMHRGAVDLSSLAHAITTGLTKAEPSRQVTTVIAEGLRTTGDERLLRTALDHLLGNAWKFSGKVEKPTVEFGSLEIEGEPTYFVRDNGAGFDAAYATKLFSPFQRLHSEQDFAGRGIGLAIVRRIIGRHGGRVWADGAVGKGATVFFTLARAAT